MHTIYNNSNVKGYDYESFKKEMIEICNQHRNEKRALAFAFILYDFENPQVKKILEDKDYWLALNSISGEYLTIFSLDYKEEGFKRIRYMTNFSTYNNPSEGTNKLIKKYFGSNFKVKYPAVLFFQVDNKHIIDSLLIELKEEMIESAFLELKEYLNSSVDALKQISPGYRDNIKEIFDNLEINVKHTQSIRSAKRVLKNVGNITGLLSAIKGLL